MPKPIAADLKGKTCIVTGANAGIGREAARELARMGADVVLACRSEERGRAALEQLQKDASGSRLSLSLVDFSSQRGGRFGSNDLRRTFC